MASGTTMTDQEIVTFINDKWLEYANVVVDPVTRANSLAYVKANGLNTWQELLMAHPLAVAWRQHLASLT